MAIYVYHNPDFLEFYRGARQKTADLRRLYLAAIVATDKPDVAYHFTQHVGVAWYHHPNVITVVRSRSTSVGDVLETEDGRLLQVAPFGFKEIAGKSLPADNTRFVQTLRGLAAENEVPSEVLVPLVAGARQLYTALLFAAYALESVSAGEAGADPDSSLIARFAARQARWALTQADGG